MRQKPSSDAYEQFKYMLYNMLHMSHNGYALRQVLNMPAISFLPFFNLARFVQYEDFSGHMILNSG